MKQENECQNISILFKTVSCDIVESKEIFKVKITFSKKKHFEDNFYIMQHLNEGCVLGIDFLIKNGITVDPADVSKYTIMIIK